MDECKPLLLGPLLECPDLMGQVLAGLDPTAGAYTRPFSGST
jgi:hypothetical protein